MCHLCSPHSHMHLGVTFCTNRPRVRYSAFCREKSRTQSDVALTQLHSDKYLNIISSASVTHCLLGSLFSSPTNPTPQASWQDQSLQHESRQVEDQPLMLPALQSEHMHARRNRVVQWGKCRGVCLFHSTCLQDRMLNTPCRWRD